MTRLMNVSEVKGLLGQCKVSQSIPEGIHSHVYIYRIDKVFVLRSVREIYKLDPTVSLRGRNKDYKILMLVLMKILQTKVFFSKKLPIFCVSQFVFVFTNSFKRKGQNCNMTFVENYILRTQMTKKLHQVIFITMLSK